MLENHVGKACGSQTIAGKSSLGKSCGNFCLNFLWEQGGGEILRKILQERHVGKSWWVNLLGASCGKSSGKCYGNSTGPILQENLAGKSCGKILWEILAGKSCGKILMGKSCGKILWEILVGKSCGKILRENHVGNLVGSLAAKCCRKILWENRVAK